MYLVKFCFSYHNVYCRNKMSGFFMLCSQSRLCFRSFIWHGCILCVCVCVLVRSVEPEISSFFFWLSGHLKYPEAISWSHTHPDLWPDPGLLGLIVLWWLARRSRRVCRRVSVWTQPDSTLLTSPTSLLGNICRPAAVCWQQQQSVFTPTPALKTWKLPWWLFSYAMWCHLMNAVQTVLITGPITGSCDCSVTSGWIQPKHVLNNS